MSNQLSLGGSYKWKYLKPIATDFKSDEVWVELLIGANCVKALEQIHAIASEDGDTYAFRTRPGMVYNKNNNSYCKCLNQLLESGSY